MTKQIETGNEVLIIIIDGFKFQAYLGQIIYNQKPLKVQSYMSIYTADNTNHIHNFLLIDLRVISVVLPGLPWAYC